MYNTEWLPEIMHAHHLRARWVGKIKQTIALLLAQLISMATTFSKSDSPQLFLLAQKQEKASVCVLGQDVKHIAKTRLSPTSLTQPSLLM